MSIPILLIHTLSRHPAVGSLKLSWPYRTDRRSIHPPGGQSQGEGQDVHRKLEQRSLAR
jgi:hypothetical protein